MVKDLPGYPGQFMNLMNGKIYYDNNYNLEFYNILVK